MIIYMDDKRYTLIFIATNVLLPGKLITHSLSITSCCSTNQNSTKKKKNKKKKKKEDEKKVIPLDENTTYVLDYGASPVLRVPCLILTGCGCDDSIVE